MAGIRNRTQRQDAAPEEVSATQEVNAQRLAHRGRLFISTVVVAVIALLATLASPIPLGISPAMAQDLPCVGGEFQSQDDAKDSYAAKCGQIYDSQSGFHRCDWVSFGWICGGPRSEGGDAPATPADPDPDPEPAPDPEPDPDTGALVAPDGLTARLRDGQVTLEWDLDDDRIVGVNVYRNNQYKASVNQPTTQWIDPDGAPASTYHVVAYDRGGANFAESSSTQVGFPAAPYLRAGGWESDVDQGVQLLWNSLEGAAGYNVYRGDEFVASTSVPNYRDLLSVDGIYTYYVQAYDSTGDVFSPESNEAEARVGIAPEGNQPPSPPTNLRFERNENEVTLSWDASTDDFSQPTYLVYSYPAQGTSPVRVTRGTSYTLNQDSTASVNYQVRADDGHELSRGAALLTVGPVITGTEHGYISWTFDRLRVTSTIDDEAQLKDLVSALFAEYDPLTGNPGSERSQKRQYNYNRGIAWALLGVDAATNNESCCGRLRLGFVWNNLMGLIIDDEYPRNYKGSSASDREFYDSWEAATPNQRLEYLGFEPDQYFKALPFMEAAGVNLGIINDYKSAEFDLIVGTLLGLGLSFLTVGLLPPGTNVFVQGAVGGAVAGGVSTLYITGDIEDALEAAGEGAIWGGIAAWADELTGWNKVLANVTLAAAKAEVLGGDPRAAALNALTGELVDGIAANTTFETAEANALQKLTPVFGASTAGKLVDFASATSVQLVSELTVLYLLNDDIDLSTEANRIFLGQFAAAIGNETEDLIKPMGDHVSRVIGDLVETGINTDWDEDELQSTLASSLAPVVAGWISALTPDGSNIELILLGGADQVAGLNETPNALALDAWIEAKTLEIKQYVNDTIGFDLFDLDE